MGRNSFLLPKIRRAFEHAHQLLTAAIKDAGNTDSYLSFVVRSDDPILANRTIDMFTDRSNALFIDGNGGDTEAGFKVERDRTQTQTQASSGRGGNGGSAADNSNKRKRSEAGARHTKSAKR